MPSIDERPCTPPPAQQEATVGSADGASVTHMSSDIAATKEAKSTDFDSAFFDKHLRPCPPDLYEALRVKNTVQRQINALQSITSQESKMYGLLVSLFNQISYAIYNARKGDFKERLKLNHPFLFLDHHSCPLAHFPRSAWSSPDLPDVIGVFQQDAGKEVSTRGFEIHHDGTFRGVPYHRVETIIEAKLERDARTQASSCLYKVQQARPDRPAMYGLSVRARGFQLLYASPLGVKASEPTPWTELRKLCAFVYSMYDPPPRHILYDHSISWHEGSRLGPSTWTFKAAGFTYVNARLVFIGYPWGRRTSILRVKCSNHPALMSKDSFVDKSRRFLEATLLALIHADGDIPGAVRLISHEDVKSDEEVVTFIDEATGEIKTRRRLVLADTGVQLEHAKSVNDLLKAIYDVLEVHRNIAQQRRVLHRDMSIFNILMYPTNAVSPPRWLPSFPPLIDEILAGERQDPAARTARCLLIDFDHGARLRASNEVKRIPGKLKYRTGTPMYIARAVCESSVLCAHANLNYTRMPLLSDRARAMYIKLHGEHRYNKYNDNPSENTYHGGIRAPGEVADIQNAAQDLEFYHRWEYDAESVFWTMFSILLRVCPQGHEETSQTEESLLTDWGILKSHFIPQEDHEVTDSRDPIFTRHPKKWPGSFLPVMRDVAFLLRDIAAQVAPSYAAMAPPPPHDDHLHEAMQRLILEYLVKHEDDPIPLTPGVLRKAVNKDGEGGRTRGTMTTTQTKGTGGSKRPRNEDEDPARISKRHIGVALEEPPALVGQWDGTVIAEEDENEEAAAAAA